MYFWTKSYRLRYSSNSIEKLICFAIISIIPCLMVYYIASVLFLLGDAQKL